MTCSGRFNQNAYPSNPTRMMMQQTIPLANGVHIPLLGLGVYQPDPGAQTQQTIFFRQ
jgi:hypothetical protein